MSQILNTNAEYAEKMKTILGLRAEPVAVKLIKEGDEYPEGPAVPDAPLSHCQAVFRARKGECLRVPYKMQGCHVGTSVLGMSETPDKVASGDFHAGVGIHDSSAAAKEMIDERAKIPYATAGEVVCPLKKADFVPDVVILVDIVERIYWITSMMTAEKGGRATFSTSPFQCACEDITALPMTSGSPNVSLGCFGCRKRTDMAPDELACGIPYKLIPGYIAHLEKYSGPEGAISKAKRD